MTSKVWSLECHFGGISKSAGDEDWVIGEEIRQWPFAGLEKFVFEETALVMTGVWSENGCSVEVHAEEDSRSADVKEEVSIKDGKDSLEWQESQVTKTGTGMEDVELLSTLDWLSERHYFYLLQQFKIFYNFRSYLYGHLFCADELFQSCLLYVRGLFEDALNLKKNNEDNPSAVCLIKVAEKKDIKEYFESKPSEIGTMHFKLPQYRFLLETNLKFLRLIDYLFQELIRQLMNSAVSQLLEVFIGSARVPFSKEKKNERLMRKIFSRKISNDDGEFINPSLPPPSVQNSEPKPDTDVNVILNRGKVEMDLKRTYAPIFEVNLCLRILSSDESPEDSEEKAQKSDQTLDESLTCDDDELFENRRSYVRTSSEDLLLKYNQPSKFGSLLRQILSATIVPLHQDPRLSTIIELVSVPDLSKESESIVKYKKHIRWPDYHILFETDADYQNKTLDSSLHQLACEPAQVEEFVDHFNFLEEITSSVSELEKDVSTISQLYSVVRDYQIDISEEQKAIYRILFMKFNHLKTAMKLIATNKEAILNKFRNSLETHIIGLRVDVSNLKDKIRSPILLCGSTPVPKAKDLVKSLTAEAANLTNKVKTYASYQDYYDDSQSHMHSLNMEEITQIVLTEISEIECDLMLRKLLWDAQEEWGTLFWEWRGCTLQSIDMDLVRSNVSKWLHIIIVLEKGLPKSDMVAHLKQSVLDFKQELPILTALGNPCLKPRHWEALREITGKSVSLDKNLSVEKLLALKMFPYERKINEISVSATNEAALEKMLFKVIEVWNNSPLHLIFHHTESSSILIIASIDDTITQLEDSQAILATIKGSSYLMPIKVLVMWREIMSRVLNKLNALHITISTGVIDVLKICNANLENIKKSLEPHLVKCFENIKHMLLWKQEVGPPAVKMLISAEGEGLVLPKKIRVRAAVEQWMVNVEKSMYDVLKNQIMFNSYCMKGFMSSNPREKLEAAHAHVLSQMEDLTALVTLNTSNFRAKVMLAAMLTISVYCRDIVTDLLDKNISSAEDFDWTRHLRYKWDEKQKLCYISQGNTNFVYGYEYLGCAPRLVITPLTERCWLTLTTALSFNLGGCNAGPAGVGKTETIKDLARSYGKHCVVFNCFEDLDYKIMGKLFFGLVQSGAWCCFDEFNRIDIEVLSVIASQILTIKVAKDSYSVRYRGRVELPGNLKSLFRPVAMMVPHHKMITEIILFSFGFKSSRSLSGKLVNLYDLASKQLSKQEHYDFGMKTLKTVLIMAEKKKQEYKCECDKSLSEADESLIIIEAIQEASLSKFLPEDAPPFEKIMEDTFSGVTVSKVRHLALELVGRKGKVDVCVLNPKCITLSELYGQLNINTMEWSDGLLSAAVRNFVHISTAEYSKNDSDLGLMSRITDLSNIFQVGVSTAADIDNNVFMKEVEKDVKTPETYNFDWQWIVLDGPVDTLWIENLNTVLDENRTLCLANSERMALTNKIRVIFEVDSIFNATPSIVTRCAVVYMDPVDLGWKPYIKSWLLKTSKIISQRGMECLGLMITKSVTEGLEFLKRHRKFMPYPIQDVSVVMTLCRILDALFEFMHIKRGGAKMHNILLYTFPPHDDLPHQGASINTAKDYELKPPKLYYRDENAWYLEKNPEKLTVMIQKIFVFAFTWAFGGVLKREDQHEEDLLFRSSFEPDSLAEVTYNFDNLVHELFEEESERDGGINLPGGERSIFGYFVDLQNCEFMPWSDLVPSAQTIIQRGTSLLTDFQGSSDSVLRMKECGEHVNYIATRDTICLSFLVSLLLKNSCPVLLTGDTGVGKTTTITEMLDKLEGRGTFDIKFGSILGKVLLHNEIKRTSLRQNINILIAETYKAALGGFDQSTRRVEIKNDETPVKNDKGIIVSTINFTTNMTATKTKELILRKLVRRTKDILGAPKNNRIVVYIDDLNMPVPDTSGAQPPLELIRQLLEMGGLYDTERNTWKTIQDLAIIASCAPSASGNDVSPRLLKHFSLLVLPHPPQSALYTIFRAHLGMYFSIHNFVAEVQRCRDQIVLCSLAIYYQVCKNMLPTPTKCHYMFNPRDMFKLLLGLMQADKSVINSKEMAAKLLVHEASRVFHDRLVESSEKSLFYQLLSKELQNHLQIQWTHESLMNSPTVFVDFMDINKPHRKKIYQSTNNYNKIFSILKEFQMKLGSTSLEIGIDGCGKETYATLACYVAEHKLHRVPIAHNSAILDFREMFKKVFIQAGLEGTPTVVMVDDLQEEQASFLEDLNYIINGGKVATLFENEELNSIVMRMRTFAEQSNFMDDRKYLLSLFQKRVSKNLHIFIIMSPVGSNFRHKCRVYPSMITACTIDWFQRWPDEALLLVANSYLGEKLKVENKMNIVTQFAPACVEIHKSMKDLSTKFFEDTGRHYYVTPSSYLKFLETFSHFLSIRQEAMQTKRNRFYMGLSKILEATVLVTDMQEELLIIGPQIEQKAKKTTNELKSVLPALEKAIVALNALDKSDISELRVYARPPFLVLTVMNAVCILLQKKPNWATAKLLLSETSFLKKLINLDKDSIPDKVFLKLRKILNLPDFNPKKIALVSVACCSMCQWVIALNDYHEVQKVVGPKQAQVAEAQNVLRIAKQRLSEKQRGLQLIEEHLHFLHTSYKEVVAEKQQLAYRKKLATKRLQCASILLTIRWQETVKEIDQKLKGICGDILLSSASIAYSGVLTPEFRQPEMQKWEGFCTQHKISLSSKFSLMEVMAEKNENAPETFPPSLMAILKKDICQKRGHYYIRIDDVEIEYNENFRLYLSTELDNPHFLPSAYNFVTIINFTVTFQGLQDQLLSTVVSHEVPHLENQRAQLLESISLDAITLEELEDKTLTLLQKTEGSVLDDEEIVETLRKSKMTSNEISKRIKETEKAEREIGAIRKNYLPIATRGALLYFVLTSLTQVEHMYQFSLEWFRQVFVFSTVSKTKEQKPDWQTDETAQEKADEMSVSNQQNLENPLTKNTKHAIDVLTRNVFRVVSSALFNEHKLCFSFRLCTTIMRDNASDRLMASDIGFLPEEEWNIFLYSDILINIKNMLLSKPRLNSQDPDLTTQKGLQDQDQAPRSPGTSPTKGLPLCRTDTKTDKLPLPSGPSSPPSAQTKLGDPAAPRKGGGVKEAPGLKLGWAREGEVAAEEEQPQQGVGECPCSISCVPPWAKNTLPTQEGLQGQDQASRSTVDLANKRPSTLQARPQKILLDLIVVGRSAISVGFTVSCLDYPASAASSRWSPPLGPARCFGLRAPVWSPLLAENSIFEIRRKEHLQWVSDLRWKQCQYISGQMEPFSLLCRSLLSNKWQWNAFRDTKAVYSLMCTPFSPEEIKVLRPDRLENSVRKFVTEKMGSEYIHETTVHLKESYKESTAQTPLILIHTYGIDLNNILLRFAQELKGTTPQVTMISLGRGQAAKAEELIFKAVGRKNQWVFLQNCHLAASFMPRLCAIIESDTYVVTVLQRYPLHTLQAVCTRGCDERFCHKIANLQYYDGLSRLIAVEPPQGLKSNLLQMFGYGGSGEVTEEIFDKNDCGPWWKKILFSLCFFNAVINERRVYGTLGWNAPYKFSSSDLEVSIKILGNVLPGRSEIPWKELNYLIAEVTYGGHVTDKWDKRCLKTLFNKFCSPEVLKANFSFSSDEGYQPVPSSASLQDCIHIIQSLPDDDSPEILGIHPEATHTCSEIKCQKFIENLITMQPKAAPVNLMINPEQSNDDLVMEILSDILVQLPLTVENEEASGTESQSTFKFILSSSMWEKLQSNVEGHDPLIHCVLITFLSQEIERFNKLLSVIHKSLKDLQLAIKGEIILTQDLEEIYDSFLRVKVPKLWQKNAYRSCKPLSFWVSDLIQRVNFFNTWAKVAYTAIHHRYMTFVATWKQSSTPANQKFRHPTDSASHFVEGFPARYWLPAFFSPHAFLTAVLQDYGRAQGISMDMLTFSHKVIHTASTTQEDEFSKLLQKRLNIVRRAFQAQDHSPSGVCVFGLFIEGARWDPEQEVLEDSLPADLRCEFPDICFLPTEIEASQASDYTDSELHTFECPVFQTPERSRNTTGSPNLLTSVHLPTKKPPSHWITMQVALLCEKNE
ncbi:Dynein heavy chain 14, axonemal [Microtus ochrogaster]|uniref:Dynein heavy chain 14, axonemal n=1 Tax=Microtus ochrogaster TaxID=79684 RepID=A0A8J6GMY7_MICOH|nr:Dynein heavy chain 14, axonemal [Microtus ochrogaster]